MLSQMSWSDMNMSWNPSQHNCYLINKHNRTRSVSLNFCVIICFHELCDIYDGLKLSLMIVPKFITH